MRHQLMPILREYNPSIDQALANLAELARDDEARWQAEVGRILPQVLLPGKPVRGGGRAVSTAAGEPGTVALEIERLRGFDPALRRRVVRAAARALGARLSFEETSRVLALAGFGAVAKVAARAGGGVQLGRGLRAERSVRELRLTRGEAGSVTPTRSFRLPGFAFFPLPLQLWSGTIAFRIGAIRWRNGQTR